MGTAVVLGLWLLVSYLPGKKAEAREEARFFSDLGGDDDTEAMGVYTSAQIDFETMTMTSRASGIDIDERATHELRRDGGGWASRLTPASRKEEIARLEARLAKIKAGGVGFEESTREALAAVRRNDWAAFDGHEASKVDALDPEGKPGRKRKGGASKHELLKLAFVGESFIRRDTDLETAYRRAKSRREARKARAKEREKRSGLSADDDA